MSAVAFYKQRTDDTFILSAMTSKATIMSPGLFIFFSTRSVWEKRVGEYERPSFGTVAQKFSSSLLKEGKKHSLRGGKNKYKKKRMFMERSHYTPDSDRWCRYRKRAAEA